MDRKLLREFFISAFYPKRCGFCGKPIDFRLTKCKECSESLREIRGEVCMLCGFEKKDCECKGARKYYSATIAPFYYEGAAGKAVRRLKFSGEPEIAELLGGYMAQCVSERYQNESFDIITCVPLSPKALKKRGFNQSELLARRVAEITGIQFGELLEKPFETAEQHKLTKIRRSGNLLGCFTVPGDADLSSLKILLCDDVKTTGATLDECAKTLLVAGAESVCCVTAAIA